MATKLCIGQVNFKEQSSPGRTNVETLPTDIPGFKSFTVKNAFQSFF